MKARTKKGAKAVATEMTKKIHIKKIQTAGSSAKSRTGLACKPSGGD